MFKALKRIMHSIIRFKIFRSEIIRCAIADIFIGRILGKQQLRDLYGVIGILMMSESFTNLPLFTSVCMTSEIMTSKIK